MDATVQVREGVAKLSTNTQQNDIFERLQPLASRPISMLPCLDDGLQSSGASSDTFPECEVKNESKERWVEDFLALEVKQKDQAAVMWLDILAWKILGKLVIGFLLFPMSQPPFMSLPAPRS